MDLVDQFGSKFWMGKGERNLVPRALPGALTHVSAESDDFFLLQDQVDLALMTSIIRTFLNQLPPDRFD